MIVRSRWAVALVVLALAVPIAPAWGQADQRAPRTRHELRPAPGGGIAVTLFARDAGEGPGVERTQYRIDGGPWHIYGEEVIFDGTPQSFARWRQAPVGQFVLLPDGTLQTAGGMGMLWFAEKPFGDVAFKLEFRDAAPDGYSNGGVFVRFPNPDEAVVRPPQDQHECQAGGPGMVWTAWVAIACGHEVQIYDGPTGEVQKTGSVYNFKSLDHERAGAVAKGEWSDYEVRTVGDGTYTITVIRDGRVLNRFVNAPGKTAARDGDPPTDLRQFARGYVGLQNHLPNDVIQIRNVRVQQLRPRAGTFTVTKPGRHLVEYRSTDYAGNVERVRSVRVDVRG